MWSNSSAIAIVSPHKRIFDTQLAPRRDSAGVELGEKAFRPWRTAEMRVSWIGCVRWGM